MYIYISAYMYIHVYVCISIRLQKTAPPRGRVYFAVHIHNFWFSYSLFPTWGP